MFDVPRLAVVNDDLTGCNVTGAIFVERGVRVVSLVDPLETWFRALPPEVVLMVNTDSRTLPAPEAYQRVQLAVRQLEAAGVRVIGKRIDSALRGSLGAEIDAILDLRGPEGLAVVVPSVPADGRTMIGGHMLFGGVVMHRAEVGTLPGVPSESYVPAILEPQTRRPIGRIDLVDVEAGPAAVASRLRERAIAGDQVVVVDCASARDSTSIAEGILASGLDVVAADAGAISAELAYRLLGRRRQPPIFLVVGSRSSLTTAQLDELRRSLSTLLIEIDADDLLVDAVRQEAVARAAMERLIAADQAEVLGIIISTTKASPGADQPVIAARLARIASQVLLEGRPPIGGLFLSGGDTAVEVCRALEIEAIEVQGQVATLRPYGRAIGGAFDRLPIVTKGGTVGARSAIVEAVRFLQRAAMFQQPRISIERCP